MESWWRTVQGTQGTLALTLWCSLTQLQDQGLSFTLTWVSRCYLSIFHFSLAGLPELSLEDFKKVELRDFSWVHVEGRNKANVLDILSYLNQEKKVKFSVEVEKVNRGFEDFLPFGDVVFISKVFKSAILPLSQYSRMLPNTMDIRQWRKLRPTSIHS